MDNDSKPRKERETTSRHLQIGIIGPIASGKTEIARLLNKRWKDSKHVEELFGNNPYLDDFYNNPCDFSFKSQEWFLEQKIYQLSLLKEEMTEIIDPSLEMDRIYAKTQNSIGWMKDSEWKIYQDLFDALIDTYKISKPDYFLVINASEETLLSRVQERIIKGGRDFEKWILQSYPDYLGELAKNVRLWRQGNSNLPILEIDTDYYEFSKIDKKQELLNRIDSNIALWLTEKLIDKNGARLLAPKYISPRVSRDDRVPGFRDLSQ